MMKDYSGTTAECMTFCRELTSCRAFVQVNGKCAFLGGVITAGEAAGVGSNCYYLLAGPDEATSESSDFAEHPGTNCSGEVILAGKMGSAEGCMATCSQMSTCTGFVRSKPSWASAGTCDFLAGNLSQLPAGGANVSCFTIQRPVSTEPASSLPDVECNKCVQTGALGGSNDTSGHVQMLMPDFWRAIDIQPTSNITVGEVSFYCSQDADVEVGAAIYAGGSQDQGDLVAKAPVEKVKCQAEKWFDLKLSAKVTLSAGATYLVAQVHKAGLMRAPWGHGNLNVKTHGAHFWTHLKNLKESIPLKAPASPMQFGPNGGYFETVFPAKLWDSCVLTKHDVKKTKT